MNIFRIIPEKIVNFVTGLIFVLKNLYLFAELVHARADTLLIYKDIVLICFHHSIYVDFYKSITLVIKHLLQSLLNVYPIGYDQMIENVDKSFIDFLSIQEQHVDHDQLEIHYHISNKNKIYFTCEFINEFFYGEF
ncbi:hypothetical protein I4U23_026994 [Adineta vaga]|nr:hypothetical protein I4U23_026994 [Adineta vaga]